MKLMLLTLRKDLRRLWPVILLTLVMLAALGRMDRWRADWMVSSTESWLTILLTLAWSCLAALAVLEEPLVGDRHFWTTRPHRWLPLLSAKIVFVLLTIHLPLLLENGYVLLARGFNPAADLGNLLAKQALIFGAVTLPAIAVATVVRTFTHFVTAAFAVAVTVLIVNGGFEPVAPWLP